MEAASGKPIREAVVSGNPQSLRHRKKEQQRLLLLKAAEALFRDRGFDGTRIEDIAAEAGVGVATVYNYFSTKNRILADLVQLSTDEGQPRIAAAAAREYRDPVDAIVALVDADFGELHDADKALWRELLSSMTRDQENRERIEANRGRFRRHLKDAVERLIGGHVLKKTSDISALVDVCYAIYAYHFRQLVCLEAMTKRKALQAIRRDLRTLMSGVRVE